MTKLLALSHSWETQRGDGEKKRPAEWISDCLKEKFNESSKMKLEEELEKKHTSRCFALSKIHMLLCSPVLTPSRDLQWLHSLAAPRSAKLRNPLLGREWRQREMQTDLSQVTPRSPNLNQ